MADQTLSLNLSLNLSFISTTMAERTPAPAQRTIENLPSEVIQDILSRLPINSLLESRCVSPRWGNLINNSRFAIIHYDHLIRNEEEHQQSCSLLSGKYSFCYIRDFNVCEKVTEFDYNNIPFRNFLPVFSIVGSVNGVVCLEDHSIETPQETRSVVLCNPVNGDWLKLPDASILNTGIVIFFGFGYCPKNCEYKVVRMGIHGYTGDMTVDIITVGDDSWRSLGSITKISNRYLNANRVRNRDHCGVYLNGYLHWLLPDQNKCDTEIRAFNVEDETFTMVPFPERIRDEHIHTWQTRTPCLGVLNGYLMLVDNSKSSIQEVWIMKEYGVKESWVLEYVIPRLDYEQGLLRPLAVQNNEKVLEYGDRNGYYQFYSFDIRKRTVEKLKVSGPIMYSSLVLHVGSLVSLKDVIAHSYKSRQNY